MRCSLNFYYANRDKYLAKRRKYYHNNTESSIDLEENRRNKHKSEIDEPYNKDQNLTQAMESLKTNKIVA